MTAKLHNLVAKYMNKTIDIEEWEDIRKKYFEYSYLAFMTLCAHEIKSDCAANEIENIIGMNDIIEESILCYVLKIPGSYEFISEVLSIINDYDAFDINCLLYRVKILEFKSQGIEKFDIEEFSQQYENLLKELQEKEVPNKIIFQEKQVELYKSIHRTYYHNEKPYHTVGELQSKEQYVAKLFNDSLSLQLSTEETQLRKLKRDCEEYKKKTEDMTDAIKILISKYEDANKEYQTQLLNAIKIPLMVYSGRIIQNYPLGLGIRAIIKTNQLVFEAASKSGSDVYNILSTGQLNGLSIALLLSIKNVYGDTKGLDILLIDDPLQTIDDISAISLADLLTQQGIGQIVLSTHEETKAALLRYKFKHAGMSVREQNMQALYMKTVTEE